MATKSKPETKFIQLHTLITHAAALLNRDDAGRAKRLTFGNTDRIRVSSQCQKRRYREEAGRWSVRGLGTSVSTRSRRIFSDVIPRRLRDLGDYGDAVLLAVLRPLRAAVVGEKAKTGAKAEAAEGAEAAAPKLDELRTAQIMVVGEPELDFLTARAKEVIDEGPEKDAEARAKTAFAARSTGENLKALGMASGIDGALFGRMATSDIMSRTDAAVHVAHAFTVHTGEAEPDYFSAVDDIAERGGEIGAGHINTSELTSGVFYGYTVVDVDQLVSNLGGDRELAAEAARHLTGLTATTSPGAKKGATAPYAYADLLLVEFGDRQPRGLANAFQVPTPVENAAAAAAEAMAAHLKRYDRVYQGGERRTVVSTLEQAASFGLGRTATLDEAAEEAAAAVRGGE